MVLPDKITYTKWFKKYIYKMFQTNGLYCYAVFVSLSIAMLFQLIKLIESV